MAEPRPLAFERFAGWLFFSPRGQLTLIVSSTGLLAVCVWADELAREYGYEGVFAPTRDDFWRGIAVGAAVGFYPLITVLARDLFIFQFRPLRGVSGELTGWRLWVRYIYVGFFLVLVWAMVVGLFFWCNNSELSFVPPMTAMIAVQYLIALLCRGLFGSEPSSTVAEATQAEN